MAAMNASASRRPKAVSMPTAAQLVADAIRQQIVTGVLADGESLPPEASLIEQYGVSRPTFREALRILQSESLITIRRGSRGGARVNAPTVDPVARQAGHVLQHMGTTLGDVYQARAIIEPPAAGMIASNGNKAAIRTLRAALEREQAAADDADAFAHASAHFHDEVIRLAGNNTLALFAGILHEIIEASSATVYRAEGDARHRTETSGAAHERLLDLIERGDADGAEEHWRAHLDEIGAGLRAQTLKREVDLFAG